MKFPVLGVVFAGVLGVWFEVWLFRLLACRFRFSCLLGLNLNLIDVGDCD